MYINDLETAIQLSDSVVDAGTLIGSMGADGNLEPGLDADVAVEIEVIVLP